MREHDNTRREFLQNSLAGAAALGLAAGGEAAEGGKGLPTRPLGKTGGKGSILFLGGRHIGSTVAQQMALAMLPGRKATPFEALSARELEVLMMLAEGRRVAEIASVMHLSPKTVATYKYRIFDKIEARNDVEMTRMALRYGIVAPA